MEMLSSGFSCTFSVLVIGPLCWPWPTRRYLLEYLIVSDWYYYKSKTRYHKYARVGVNKGNHILITIKIFNAQTCAYATYAPAKCGKFDVSQCFFQFCYRYLEIWHLLFVPHRTYTNRDGDSLFLPFCTIGISMYQKGILPYFIIPSTFSPQASSPLSHHRQTEGRTTFFTPSSKLIWKWSCSLR